MKILTNVTMAGNVDMSSQNKDTFTIGSELERDNPNADVFTVHANAIFTNDVSLGSSSADIITAKAQLTASAGISVGGNIIPSSSGSISLGSIDKPFKEVFLSSGSISIAAPIEGVTPTIISNNSGNLEVSAGGIKLLGTGSFVAVTGSFSYVSGNVTWNGNNNTLGSVTASSGFKGNLYGTSSHSTVADTASVLIGFNQNNYVTTSSFNSFSSSYNTGSFTGSFAGNGLGLTGLLLSHVKYSYYEVTGTTYTVSLNSNSPSVYYINDAAANIYLPDISSNDGAFVVIKNIGNQTITVRPSGSQTINGNATHAITKNTTEMFHAASGTFGYRWNTFLT